MLSVEEARALLGDAAKEKSDIEIEWLLGDLGAFADALIGAYRSQRLHDALEAAYPGWHERLEREKEESR